MRRQASCGIECPRRRTALNANKKTHLGHGDEGEHEGKELHHLCFAGGGEGAGVERERVNTRELASI